MVGLEGGFINLSVALKVSLSVRVFLSIIGLEGWVWSD